jgi:hypothetical protein
MPLSDAEETLVADCAAGEWCKIGDKQPERCTQEVAIRGALVRFLALGGDADHPVHEAGVQLSGAWIADAVRLSNCTADYRINLFDCMLDGPLHAFDARLRSLNLTGSSLAGLRADRVSVAGGLFLRSGFSCAGPISLAGAQIGGDLDCSGGRFDAPAANAIDLSGANIGGQIFMGDGFAAKGAVRLVGTGIGGDLCASGGLFSNPGAVAIGADALRAGGNVLLDTGTQVAGELRLAGASIAGHLSLETGQFDNAGAVAIHAENAEIGHALILRHAAIDGQVVLTDATSGSLADDLDSWPQGQVVLDGFRYQRISSPEVSSEMRLDWLSRQVPADIGATFRPQPWEHLIRVLRDMGHARDATMVAIGKQLALRRAGHIGNRSDRQRFAPFWHRSATLLRLRTAANHAANLAGNTATRWLHDAYGVIAGFGYRPGRIVMWMLVVWLVGGLYFDRMAREGIMAPAEPTLLIAALDGTKRPSAQSGPGNCGVRNEVAPAYYWWACPGMPSEYPHYNPWLFSADLILPVVDFHQFTFWAPAATYTTRNGEVRPMAGGELSKVIQWSIVLFGWAMSLMFGAIMTRLVEKD